jgi:phage gpG-like protein
MDNFHVELTGIERLRASLNGGAWGVIGELNKEMRKATIDLVGHIKSKKLSGGVLNVRTGRLRRSVTGTTSDAAGVITSEVGTNVFYGAIWEKGFKGNVTVKEHERRFSSGTSSNGKKIKIRNDRVITVRAHTRALDIKPRPWLEPSLDERYPTYQAWFAVGIERGLREGVT